MSGELNIFSSVHVVDSGRTVLTWGDLATPIQATIGATVLSRERFSVTAGSTITLWDYRSDAWEFEAMIIVPDVYSYLFVQGDKPTSDSDLTPLGTHRCWSHQALTATVPFWLTADDMLVNSTAADFASDTGSNAPTLATDAGTVLGRVYKVQLKNPGTEDGSIERLIIG